MEWCDADIRQEAENVTALRSQAGNDREETLHESTASITPRTIAPLAPEDGGAKRSFGVVVGWLNAIDLRECPESPGALDEVMTEARDLLEAAESACDEKRGEIPSEWVDLS